MAEQNNLPAVSQVVENLPTKEALVAALDSNKTSVANALAYGEKLLEELKAGMTAEKDEKANAYLVKLRKTLDKCNSGRMPFTRALDALIKEFTSLENQIAPGKGIYAQIQNIRDTYARKLADDKRQEQERIIRQQNAAKERETVAIQIKAAVEQAIIHIISEDKKTLLDLFERVTLDTYDKVVDTFKEFQFVFKIDRWNAIQPSVNAQYLTSAEIENVTLNAKAGKFDDVASNYTSTMKAFCADLLDKFPSKKAELEKMAAASAEEAERLRQEAEARRVAEEAKQAEEARLAAEEAQEAARTQMDIAEANAAMDKEIALAQVESETGAIASTRKATKIEVINQAGWLEIISFYFRNEGNKLSVDDLGKKKLDTMKTFAEKAARAGEFIESKNLRYVDDIKTIATAA